MRRKLVSIWVSMLFILSILYVIDISFDVVVERVSGTTRYVNTTGSGGAYTKIQDAIDAANPGDTVFIYGGTYYQSIFVDKTINITGEGKDITIINGNSKSQIGVIRVEANWVNITKLSVIESKLLPGYSGIHLNNVSYCRISNNNISNDYLGIHLVDTSEINITNNTFYEAGIVIEGYQIQQWNTHNIDTSNTVNEKPVHYWKNETGGTIPMDAGQVILVNCSNIYVENQELTSASIGIQLGYSSDNIIQYNNVSANTEGGIYLYKSWNNTIYNNNASMVLMSGLHIKESYDNNITNNIISSCGHPSVLGFHTSKAIFFLNSSGNIFNNNEVSLNNIFALYLSQSHNNTIKYNNFSLNKADGIYLSSSNNNNITENELLSQSRYGIYLEDSKFNLIDNNSALNNRIAIFLRYSSENKIHGNNILNNTYHGLYIDGGSNYIYQNIVINNGDYGMRVTNCQNSSVIANIISYNNIGLFVLYSDNSTLSDNNISFNRITGISTAGSHFININRNTLMNNYQAMGLSSAISNNITNNIVCFNNRTGIQLSGTKSYGSCGNYISNNIINSNGDHGIRLYYAHQNNIEKNNVSDNENGIYMQDTSNNSVSNNTITNNFQGLYIRSSENNHASNNSILGNAFFAIKSDSYTLAQYNYWGTTNLSIIERMVDNADFSYPLNVNPTNMNIDVISTETPWNGIIYIDKGIILDGNLTINEAEIIFNNSKGENFIHVHGRLNIMNSTFTCNYGNFTILYTNGSSGSIFNSNITHQRALSTQADGITVDSNEIHQGIYGIICLKSQVVSGLHNNTIFSNKENAIYLRNSSKGNIINNYIDSNKIGIYLEGSSNITLINNSVLNHTFGIRVDYSNENRLIYNNASINTFGIYCISSSNNNITENTCIFNEEDGICLSQSKGNFVYDNYLSDNSYRNIDIHYYSNNNTIIGNYIFNKGQFYIEESSGNKITNNYIYNNSGITLWNADYNNIVNNTLLKSGGLMVYFSNLNNITDNHFYLSNYYGIYLYSSTENRLIYNRIVSSELLGMQIVYSGHNFITSNYISDNEYGINMDKSFNNTFTNNTITNNWYGLYVHSYTNNSITNNSFLGNAYYSVFSRNHLEARYNYWGTTDLSRIEKMVENVDFSNPLANKSKETNVQIIEGSDIWNGNVDISNGFIIDGSLTINDCNISFNNTQGENFIQVNGELNTNNSNFISIHGNYTILVTNNSNGKIYRSNGLVA